MIEQDTIRLLRECDAGVKMGIASLDGVQKHIQSQKLKCIVEECKQDHKALDGEIQALLNRYRDDGKQPNPMAKGMSWMKTNMMLAVNGSDKTVADLLTDGCNMGVKSLRRYLNEYQAADEDSKDIAKRLVNLEESLVSDIRAFL